MSGGDSSGKFSFSFAPINASGKSAASNGTSSASAPKSNLELLMAKAKPAAAASTKKPTAAPFAEEDDDDDSASPSLPSLAGPSRPSRPMTTTTKTAGGKGQISRAERKAQQEALSIDNNIFDYDSVYDSMKSAERSVELAKKAENEAQGGKAKYMESFLASAQTRKLDRLRAEEKMLALEREKEGGEFDDKEKFVTEAYKKQMEEVRKAEQEEKAREEAMRKSKKGPGLSAFYKSMLDTDEAKNAAAVAASSSSTSVSATIGPSLAIRPPPVSSKMSYDDEEEYDPFLAQEAKAKASGSNNDKPKEQGAAGSTRILEDTGKEIEINDEGEVVDKRSLLRAGLNIMKKPLNPLPNSLLTSQRSNNVNDGPYKSRAVGSAASHVERMERERRRLAAQLKEDEEKKRREREEQARREEEEARRRKEGDDGMAEKKRLEAKERYLARKRAKEEEQESKESKRARED